MLADAVVGIIGAHGSMGRALGLALLELGVVPAHQLVVSSRSAIGETLLDGCLMLENEDKEPGEMVNRLITYKGTTAQGLKVMIDGGFDSLLHRALSASFSQAIKR